TGVSTASAISSSASSASSSTSDGSQHASISSPATSSPASSWHQPGSGLEIMSPRPSPANEDCDPTTSNRKTFDTTPSYSDRMQYADARPRVALSVTGDCEGLSG